MILEKDIKRLFFGFKIETSWPEELPSGRYILPDERHITLAFLGNTPLDTLQNALDKIPLPPFQIGPTGHFCHCLFLPNHHPHSVSWQVKWHTRFDYQKTLIDWLVKHSFMPKETRPFLPHVTICRSPFITKEWESGFSERPLWTTGLHLFESLGFSTYKSLWQKPFLEPFKEIEHTADVAFLVRGKNIQELFFNAETALAFTFPELTPFFLNDMCPQNIPDIVRALNQMITCADSSIGAPCKAVSYHGNVTERIDGILEWEMIVDV
jgi:2'-5' RNA ligase